MEKKKEKPFQPHSGHRKRMRKRLDADPELRGFAEHELLEIMLYGTYRRENTNVKAHLLLHSFGSLENVLAASPEELQATGAVGEKSARLLSGLGKIRAEIVADRRRRFEEACPRKEPVELVFCGSGNKKE